MSNNSLLSNLLNQKFTDFEKFQELSQQVFDVILKNKLYFRELLLNAINDEKLFSLCEHYDILDKIVLFHSLVSDIRIRLHIFADGYFDRPHNHRWSYSSKIISGAYKHTIYNLNKDIDQPTPNDLFPVIIRKEKPGDSYTLHWSQYHSVIAEPKTVTLVVRGPSEQERFRVLDKTTNEAWWQYGTLKESSEEKNQKKMSREQYENDIKKLEQLLII